jgi:hypothetical protein
MPRIMVLYGKDEAALEALAKANGVRLLLNTRRQFDTLQDDNDTTHGGPPVLAIGSPGWVGIATDQP